MWLHQGGEQVLSCAELLLEEPAIALISGRHFTLLIVNKSASCYISIPLPITHISTRAIYYNFNEF